MKKMSQTERVADLLKNHGWRFPSEKVFFDTCYNQGWLHGFLVAGFLAVDVYYWVTR
jgi:hypothetical protein